MIRIVHNLETGETTEVELTKDDLANLPTQEELKAQETARKVVEAKMYLDSTDHKFYGDYEPKDGEDLEAIRTKRSEARAYVRANDVAI